MSKRVDVIPENQIMVRYKGLYDYEGLYMLIRDWFDEHRYDFMEPLYKDKVSGPFGNEVEHKMDCELKVNEFIKFHIYIETHFYDVKEFEGELRGEKKLITDGKFSMWLSGWVEFDYSDKFKNHSKLLDFLVDWLLKRYFEVKYYDVLTYDIYGLQSQIKKFLRMDASHDAY